MRWIAYSLICILLPLMAVAQSDNEFDDSCAQCMWKPMANLLVHFKLNDNSASTTVIDSRGFTNGVANRNTSLLSTGSLNQATLSTAFNFTRASSDSVIVYNIPGNNYNSGLSFGGWVKWDGTYTTGKALPFGWDETGSWGSINIFCDSGGTLGFRFGTGSTSGYHGTTAKLQINVWAHVFATHNTTNDTFYFNGSFVTNFPSGTLVNNATYFRIGSCNEGSLKYWQSGVDDVRIYTNRVLTSNEVRLLYNQGYGIELE